MGVEYTYSYDLADYLSGSPKEEEQSKQEVTNSLLSKPVAPSSEPESTSDYDPLGFLDVFSNMAQATYNRASDVFKAYKPDREAVVNKVTTDYADEMERKAKENALLIAEQRKAGFDVIPEKYALSAAPEVTTTMLEFDPAPEKQTSVENLMGETYPDLDRPAKEPVSDMRDPFSRARASLMDRQGSTEGFRVAKDAVNADVVPSVGTNVADTTVEPPKENLTEVALSNSADNTELNKSSVEKQVVDLIGENVYAAGVLGAFTAESKADFSAMEEDTNYSLSNAKGAKFSQSKIDKALKALDPATRRKILNGGRDRAFGKALMSHYGGGGKYHGRGLIHITHDYNYKAVGDKIGVDLVENPDLVKDPRYAVPAAIAFLELNGYFDSETPPTKQRLHNIVNRYSSNAVKNKRWAAAQKYMSRWGSDSATKESPRPQARPSGLGRP